MRRHSNPGGPVVNTPISNLQLLSHSFGQMRVSLWVSLSASNNRMIAIVIIRCAHASRPTLFSCASTDAYTDDRTDDNAKSLLT